MTSRQKGIIALLVVVVLVGTGVAFAWSPISNAVSGFKSSNTENLEEDTVESVVDSTEDAQLSEATAEPIIGSVEAPVIVVSEDLQEAVDSLQWPGLLAEIPMNPDLRFDDPEFMENRVWVSENNEACSGWVSSYTVLAGDPDLYLRDCTEWQIPPGATFDITFVAEIGTYWHTEGLDRLVAHNPVLAARMEGQPGRSPMPFLAITPVTGIEMNVVYGDGTVCEGVGTAVIMAGVPMQVSFTNNSSIFAKIGIGPGGDPDLDADLVEWTIGNDVPLPTCHPINWEPGD